MPLRVRQLAAGLAALWCAACAGDPGKVPPKHRLEGSLSVLMDLGYDEARMLLSSTDFTLTFVRFRASGASGDGGGGAYEDYPIKVTYALLNDGPPSGGRVNLADPDTTTGPDGGVLPTTGFPRGVVSRNVLNDPRTSFPPIGRGTLSMSAPLDPGARIRGDFHVTFENGLEAVSGHTVYGPYEAMVNQ